MSERSELTVVGIGADGWEGLTPGAQAAVRSADVVLGGRRQLAYLPPQITAVQVAWPTPLLEALPGLIEEHRSRAVVVLASGDPMFYGIGSTLVREIPGLRPRVLAHPSSASLACARLGWALEEVEVLSAVGRPLTAVRALLAPGQRMLVLSSGRQTPGELARMLAESGYGPSRLAVFSRLGAAEERVVTGTAGAWVAAADRHDALNLIAVVCGAEPTTPVLGRGAGLPDDAFDHDGQITKREVRALTLARLRPIPGQRLWDVGAGAGSVAIEWLRAERSACAVAFERHPERVARIAGNAAALGVPNLEIVEGEAPEVLANQPAPDAVFVGGGASDPEIVQCCWNALNPGGRLVVNAVTLQTEAALAEWQTKLGGDLVRLEVSHASPIGRFTGWRPQRPVTMWAVQK